MPSYIELDKQASFPSSSNPGKIILGINNSGQVSTTDSSGQTAVVSGGGGTGLYIPKPIAYASGPVGSIVDHSYNQNISTLGNGTGLPGAIQNSWDEGSLRLTYYSDDNTFLNYNPKYFLFVYRGPLKMSGPSVSQPNTRLNNEKFGMYFGHPASYTGSYISDIINEGYYVANFTSSAAYSNFSGHTVNFGSGPEASLVYPLSFSSFTTEWNVASGSGHSTSLIGFNPIRFYWNKIADDQGKKAREFFPMRVDTAAQDGGPNIVSVTVKKGFKKYVTTSIVPPVTYVKPRVDLYIKFAIVINDPNNPGRYLIGPYSDTIKIFPKEGYFYDNIISNATYKYYYTWAWKYQ